MVAIGDVFTAGARVRVSGIYRVAHGIAHSETHYVTCVYGETFPSCRHCSGVRFELVRDATHVMRDDHFVREIDAADGRQPLAPHVGSQYESMRIPAMPSAGELRH